MPSELTAEQLDQLECEADRWQDEARGYYPLDPAELSALIAAARERLAANQKIEWLRIERDNARDVTEIALARKAELEAQLAALREELSAAKDAADKDLREVHRIDDVNAELERQIDEWQRRTGCESAAECEVRLAARQRS